MSEYEKGLRDAIAAGERVIADLRAQYEAHEGTPGWNLDVANMWLSQRLGAHECVGAIERLLKEDTADD
jgi:hypothetical protein